MTSAPAYIDSDTTSAMPLEVATHAPAEAERDEAANPIAHEAQATNDRTEPEQQTEYAYDRDYRFWCIILALCTMQVLCSLENTVVVTSLPTIVGKLGLGSSYIWVTNIFFLAT